MGWMNLLPEEAYYWNYAQHLDIGYLDHPPMMAWFIWLSTLVFGNSEFAVRLPAFIGWFAFAFFVFRFAANFAGRIAAYWTLILISILPIYFSIGFLMTPDAPMYVAWAACLYFLERALLARKNTGWWGVGIFLGLGFLSKYSIGLLGLATIIFLVIDKSSRFWWKRPGPYLSALLSLAIFSPVLIWNWNNNWISFVFQEPRRWSGGIDFSLHTLIGSALVLLTPVGLIKVAQILMRRSNPGESPGVGKYNSGRKRLFVLVFTLVPLMVFIIHSLRSQPKLNWTGALWLAVIPLVALDLGSRFKTGTAGKISLRGAWTATLVFLVAFYLSGMSYISLGMPGITTSGLPLPTAWEELYQKLDKIESHLEERTNQEPLIVGMDDYWISSELAFYGAADRDNTYEYGGRHLFGENSLMWNFWAPQNEMIGKNIIVVSFKRSDLEYSNVYNRFKRVSRIMTDQIYNSRNISSRFYYRIGYGYKG